MYIGKLFVIRGIKVFWFILVAYAKFIELYVIYQIGLNRFILKGETRIKRFILKINFLFFGRLTFLTTRITWEINAVKNESEKRISTEMTTLYIIYTRLAM